MSVKKDLLGYKYNNLTVTEEAGRASNGNVNWLCGCDCGNSRIVPADSLRSGRVKACKECVAKNKKTKLDNKLLGKRFKNLIVLSKSEYVGDQHMWLCRCDCGNEVIVRGGNLTSGTTRSCGCKRGAKHGLSHTPEYGVWSSMKARCLNPRDSAWRYYGGRGITVCNSWLDSFVNFYEDMGPRPNPSYSIDRIDSDGNYEPSNCKWASPQEQWDNRKIRGMSFDHYQAETGKTAVYPDDTDFDSIVYCALGLTSEAGEVCSVIKKVIRDGGQDFTVEAKKAIAKELGDCAWYMAQLATSIGMTLEQIAEGNLEKLSSRKDRGVLSGSGDNR